MGRWKLKKTREFILLSEPRPGRKNAKRIKTEDAGDDDADEFDDAPEASVSSHASITLAESTDASVPTLIVTTPEGMTKYPYETVNWPARDTKKAWFVRPLGCERRPKVHMSSPGGDDEYARRIKKCAMHWLDFQEMD